MNYYINDIRLKVIKCNKPSFNNYGGKCWDYGFVEINKEKIKAYIEVVRGSYFYFFYNNIWYKARMQSTIIEDLHGQSYDINPMEYHVNISKIITK